MVVTFGLARAVLLAVVVAGVALTACKGKDEASSGKATVIAPSSAHSTRTQAELPASAVAKPAAPPTARVGDDGGRPGSMPCRLEQYDRIGLFDWWSFKYEGGRLVAGRDENLARRLAAAKIRSQAAVDAEMASEPWGITYTYDSAGRLIAVDAQPTSSSGSQPEKTAFKYGPTGSLVSYIDEYGEHKLKVTAGRVEADSYLMGPMPVTVRYEYGSLENPWKGKPMIWGRELTFGDEKSYLQMQGRPAALARMITYAPSDGRISEIQGYHMGGMKGDRITFVYDCSTPVQWAQ